MRITPILLGGSSYFTVVLLAFWGLLAMGESVGGSPQFTVVLPAGAFLQWESAQILLGGSSNSTVVLIVRACLQ